MTRSQQSCMPLLSTMLAFTALCCSASVQAQSLIPTGQPATPLAARFGSLPNRDIGQPPTDLPESAAPLEERALEGTSHASLLGNADWLNSSVVTADYTTADDVDSGVKLASYDVGGVTVTPYGILWGDMIYASSRTVPGQFVLWIASEEDQGESTFVIDARRSRVGVDIKGPTVDLFGGITGGGKVEVDFLGNFITENQADTRLRHIYWEAKNDNLRFLVGQNWDVISPLLPNTVNFSVGWAAGNIGFRRAQFRVERYLHLANGNTLTLQGALAQNVIPDLASGARAVGVTRETGNWPMIQGRMAYTFEHGYCSRPVTIGVSGDVGETGFDFAMGDPSNPGLGPLDDARFFSWSFNMDAKVPVTDRLSFQGEFFTGANMSNVLGGIVQGVCPCLRVPIRSTGGWAEVAYDLTPYLQTHVGFGIDDPRDADSLIGRTYNRFVYANMFLDITDDLRTGLEVSFWRTSYHNRTDEPGFVPIASAEAPGKATVLDWTVQYRF